MLKTATFTRSSDPLRDPYLLTLRGTSETKDQASSIPRAWTSLGYHTAPSVAYDSGSDNCVTRKNFLDKTTPLPTKPLSNQKLKRELREGNEVLQVLPSTKPLAQESRTKVLSESPDRLERWEFPDALDAESGSSHRQRLSQYLGEVLNPAFQVPLSNSVPSKPTTSDNGAETSEVQSGHSRKYHSATGFQHRQSKPNSGRVWPRLPTSKALRGGSLTHPKNGNSLSPKFDYPEDRTSSTSDDSSSTKTSVSKQHSLLHNETTFKLRATSAATKADHQRRPQKINPCTTTYEPAHVHATVINPPNRSQAREYGQSRSTVIPVCREIGEREHLNPHFGFEEVSSILQEVFAPFEEPSNRSYGRQREDFGPGRHSRNDSESDFAVLHVGIATAKRIIAVSGKQTGESNSVLRPRLIKVSKTVPRKHHRRDLGQDLFLRGTRQLQVSLKA